MQETGAPRDDGPDKVEPESVEIDEHVEAGVGVEDEARLFKRSVIAWTLRLGAVLLVVTAVIGDKAVVLGAVFGLCIGLTNFELMARFNRALLKGTGRGGSVALLGWVLRLALLFGAAAAVYWKGWSYVTAAIGCFLVYPVLMVHGLLGGRRAVASSADAKG